MADITILERDAFNIKLNTDKSIFLSLIHI